MIPLASLIGPGDNAARSQEAPMSFKPRVFSGMQPTGSLHLGNYLGAAIKWIEMQKSHECIYCVVDMHAITVWQEPKELREATRAVAAAYLASGLDPRRSIIFNQSQVAAHAELAWVFNCIARLGWLSRMTQFKEKTGKDAEKASVGLYAYPNLMAADILAYHATHVPVGDDQKQHLELCRDIAQKFNNDYGESIRERGHGDAFFPLPEPVIEGPATRIMSLRDGTKKMSKSDSSEMSRINLTDDADTIAKKLQKAKTDPLSLPSEVAGLADRPEADNLVGIYAALAGTTREKVLAEFGGAQFSSFKKALTEVAVARLAPVSEELRRLLADPGAIDAVLADGAVRARAIAQPIVDEVKEIVGFLR
jgi:tryptophanyl-tRNA synthetase